MSDKKTKRPYTNLFAAAMCLYLAVLPVALTATRFTPSQISGIDIQVVANTLAASVNSSDFPQHLEFETSSGKYDAKITYTFDRTLQDFVEAIYQRYAPDHGAFVALDAERGSVLAMTSYSKNPSDLGNLNLRATYPAASVFKLITAAAALDRGLVEPESVMPFNGKSTSLYKKQVFKLVQNKWTRKPTLRKAFAQSMNPVFARLGVFSVGAESLNSYASDFGFNDIIQSDMFFDTGSTNISPDQWRVAESASGFTLSNTLSPIHGAMLASAAVNAGRMAEPYVVESITDRRGVPLFVREVKVREPSISAAAAEKLRVLMRETVRTGSARKSFRKFFRGEFKDVEVGGKTGSLTGDSPAGRYDWFVGYAVAGPRKIAFASLTINKEYWTVKSAYVARRFIEQAFSDGNREL